MMITRSKTYHANQDRLNIPCKELVSRYQIAMLAMDTPLDKASLEEVFDKFTWKLKDANKAAGLSTTKNEGMQ